MSTIKRKIKLEVEPSIGIYSCSRLGELGDYLKIYGSYNCSYDKEHDIITVSQGNNELFKIKNHTYIVEYENEEIDFLTEDQLRRKIAEEERNKYYNLFK